MVVMCLILVSADEGEYCYEQGSLALSKGDISSARTNFECAVNNLYGLDQTMAQEVLDMVNSLESSSSRSEIIEGEDWFFIGEIDNGDSSTHIYYDLDGNSVTHTLFEDQIDFSEFISQMDDLVFSDRGGAPGNTNWEVGYQSETYSPVSGVNSYVMAWNCEDTGNVAYITYSDDFDEYSLWGSIYVCPSSSFKWWYVLVVLVLAGFGYLGYVNMEKVKKIIKK